MLLSYIVINFIDGPFLDLNLEDSVLNTILMQNPVESGILKVSINLVVSVLN